ncbi:hypothetical protein PBRA_007355 [Plasmodiophora brassicae]|uniref:Protein ARV n=1 Tax=Plasmodiophora brassicae TaxID=37360 RepID=A0A0G4IWM8_PLABS|nr:hypothetical protein PBRA_007355 [Plasmodiophora brassicae]
MICVECGHDVSDVYKEFSRGSFRLTRCDRCRKTADKYVEFELMLVIIDLILQKAQVYRHLLFNQLPTVEPTLLHRTILKLVPGILFFDVYLHWHRLRLHYSVRRPALVVFDVAPFDRYASLFWIATAHLFVYIVVIVVATRLLYGKGMARRVPAVARPTPASDCDAGVDYGQLVRSIVISSFGKLLVVLMMIWESNAYYGPIVNLFVLTSNVTALRVFLKTTLLKSVCIISAAVVAKICLQLVIVALDPGMIVTVL